MNKLTVKVNETTYVFYRTRDNAWRCPINNLTVAMPAGINDAGLILEELRSSIASDIKADSVDQ